MRSILAAIVILCLTAGAAGAAGEKDKKPIKTQKNPVVFWELASNDAEKSIKFFRDVFDWDIRFSDRLKFHIVPAGKEARGVDGGIFTLKRAKLPFLTIYILVDDIKAMEKKIEKHGGHIVEPRTQTGPGVWICLFNEPSGVTFALLEQRKAAK